MAVACALDTADFFLASLVGRAADDIDEVSDGIAGTELPAAATFSVVLTAVSDEAPGMSSAAGSAVETFRAADFAAAIAAAAAFIAPARAPPALLSTAVSVGDDGVPLSPCFSVEPFMLSSLGGGGGGVTLVAGRGVLDVVSGRGAVTFGAIAGGTLLSLLI